MILKKQHPLDIYYSMAGIQVNNLIIAVLTAFVKLFNPVIVRKRDQTIYI